MLLKLIDNKKNIQKILNWNYPFSYKIFVKLIQIKKNLLSLYRWNFKWLKNIEWIKKYNIDKECFNPKKKKNWISAFARLYNSEEFLEKVVESHIPYFDEIILVNNKSTDNTEQICLKLQKKYPKIIKFYNYPFDINKIWSEKYSKTKENSVHCLSYYYNWTLSKTSYKYVIKLDDDHICIDNKIINVIDNIKKNWLKNFLQIPLINVYKINNTFSLSYSNLKSSLAWLFWDFWFFPINSKTYFIKQKWGESLIFPYSIKLWKISFLHLKWLKKWMWLNNYWWKVINKLKKRINHNKFSPLNKKYIKILKNNWIN